MKTIIRIKNNATRIKLQTTRIQINVTINKITNVMD